MHVPAVGRVSVCIWVCISLFPSPLHSDFAPICTSLFSDMLITAVSISDLFLIAFGGRVGISSFPEEGKLLMIAVVHITIIVLTSTT